MELHWKGLMALAVVAGGTALIVYQTVLQEPDKPGPGALSSDNSQVYEAPYAAGKSPDAVLSSGHSAVTDISSSDTQISEPAKSPGKFTHFQIGNRNVKSIFTDKEAVWVGTSGGAIRYDAIKNNYEHYSVRNGLLANGVFDITRLNGKIAVGTYGGGLAILDETTKDWKIYNVPEGLGDAFIYQALQMKNGDIWIATWTGVNRIKDGKMDDPDAWEIYTVENTNGGVPNDWVYGLAEGKNGELWIATEGGLARYMDNLWTNWQHSDGLGAPYEKVKDQNPFKNDPAKYSSHHAKQKIEQGLQGVNTAYNPNYIIALVVDVEGFVWVGTWGAGLSRFDGEKWKTYTVDDGLPGNHIFMLYEDNKHNLWIGTSKGLTRLDPQRSILKNYTMADGLFSEVVFSMAIDSRGTFWIGSYGGVAKIKDLN